MHPESAVVQMEVKIIQNVLALHRPSGFDLDAELAVEDEAGLVLKTGYLPYGYETRWI